jgi:hypothetical protein
MVLWYCLAAGCKNSAGGPILPTCTFVNPLQGLRAAALASGDWNDDVLYAPGTGESKRLVVESPWSQFTSECQRF